MAPKNVKLITHPLVSMFITQLRDVTVNNNPLLFRSYSREMSKLLIYEALRDLKTSPKKIKTQTGLLFKGEVSKEKVVFISILRAAIGMLSTAMEIYPNGEFHVVGIKRNEKDPKTHAPTFYLDRLYEIAKDAGRIIIMDPMLATGGTMLTVIDTLRTKYKFKKKIQIVCYIAALPGEKLIHKKYPDIEIFCAGFDPKLNNKAYIVPGLGDAGDMYFGKNTDLGAIR